MFSKWLIRNKLLVGICLLLVIVATLSWSGFHAVYAYRSLVKSLSGRASELPLAADLGRQTGQVRVTFTELHTLRAVHRGEGAIAGPALTGRAVECRDLLIRQLAHVRETLRQYRVQLLAPDMEYPQINDTRREREIVNKIASALNKIQSAAKDPTWFEAERGLHNVSSQLGQLEQSVAELPAPLHDRIHHFALEVRTQYRMLIVLTWITTISAAVMLGVLFKLFYSWIFHPLRVLVKGSRRVAAGEFTHRIKLDTNDEIAELADAMNAMTAQFQATRDDLDQQVKERTKQVVRSEQLASVGFLAAGVAHEINNPLASIALCAESLESRIEEALLSSGASAGEGQAVIRSYLRMIQDEAFRCKGITERLLDFSRMGDVRHQNADLRELVQGVIDMVAHLGTYHDKHVRFSPGSSVIAPFTAQEIKQVVLNLITNGLDSLSPGGTVQIALEQVGGSAVLTFTDNGCGMTEEVLEHLFEPFFTRRRSGQGTGLGLSITYRIVADHNGQIEVFSDGPGKGSRFRVSLPLAEKQKESEYRYQAA